MNSGSGTVAYNPRARWPTLKVGRSYVQVSFSDEAAVPVDRLPVARNVAESVKPRGFLTPCRAYRACTGFCVLRYILVPPFLKGFLR